MVPSLVCRLLNPRYSILPKNDRQRRIAILDVGCSARGGLIAHRILTNCWYEGVDIVRLNDDDPLLTYFDRFHCVDLNKAGLSFVPDRSFDYVICSHTLEHLDNGLALLPELCAKVRDGGMLYVEWPSLESQRFPVRGVGLNFFDDPTHQATFPLATVAGSVRHEGFTVQYAGRRRHKLRMLLAPLLALRYSLRERRLLLFDFWDWTGFCYVVRARRDPHGAPV